VNLTDLDPDHKYLRDTDLEGIKFFFSFKFGIETVLNERLLWVKDSQLAQIKKIFVYLRIAVYRTCKQTKNGEAYTGLYPNMVLLSRMVYYANKIFPNHKFDIDADLNPNYAKNFCDTWGVNLTGQFNEPWRAYIYDALGCIAYKDEKANADLALLGDIVRQKTTVKANPTEQPTQLTPEEENHEPC